MHVRSPRPRARSFEHCARDRRLFRELERPGLIVSNLTPNWFASIMGTGIVAVAAASLPLQFPGLRTAATVVWAIAAVLLVALTIATVLHWVRYRSTAAKHHLNPVISHFYGAPPMAFLTVGAGTILLGKDWIGLPPPSLSTGSSGHRHGRRAAHSGPGAVPGVHPPREQARRRVWRVADADRPAMVSAPPAHPPAVRPRRAGARDPTVGATASSPQPHHVAGCDHADLEPTGAAQGRSRRHGADPVDRPRTGRAVDHCGEPLASNAHTVVDASTPRAAVVALVYGFAMLGFALLWTVIALTITIRTAREHLPFSLTWWSFTFPVGTCVTGLNGLALHSGLTVVAVLAVVYYAGLVAAWITVAVRTLHGSVIRGTLLAHQGQRDDPDADQPCEQPQALPISMTASR